MPRGVVLTEKMKIVERTLGYVLDCVKQRGNGKIGPEVCDDLIRDLNVAAFHLRDECGAKGEEADIVNAFKAAEQSRREAAEKLSAYFWPLIQAVTT